MKSAQHSIFAHLKSSDHDAGDFDNNIDPETICITDIESKCNYYTDNQFDTNMQDIGLLGLSITHVNARSLNAKAGYTMPTVTCKISINNY